MSKKPNFPELALLTVKDPRSAAQIVMGWNLPKEAIWTAIALVCVVATILSTVSGILLPVPAPLNAIVANPFLYFVIAAVGFVATVYAIYWTGRMLGGQGRIEDLMVLLLWLQVLRAAAQVIILVLMILAPVLANFAVLLVAAATFWIFVQFINLGLQLNSTIRSLVVLFFGAVVLIAGLSFLLSLLGVSTAGVY